MHIMWIQDRYLANKCFLALRQKTLCSKMFLVAIGSLSNNVAAECWKVPDSLGVKNTGAVDDLKL